MIRKDPVTLNESEVEVEGEPLNFETLKFWSDTFRQTDLLQYQDESDVQMMFTNPETTTYELKLTTDDVPEYLNRLWETGERFSIRVESQYFDLDVDTARVAKLDDEEGIVTIVARVFRRGLAHVC